ncbi:MAG TPA: hypothetical protein VGK19_10725 [Capsulimonadaceae bacterium]|jgi:hypothetical protein
MQALLITIAAVLLLLYLAGKVVGALFHLIGWLMHLIPWLVLALIVAVVVMRLVGKRR